MKYEYGKKHERGELPPVGSTVRFNKNRTYTTEGFPFGLWEHGDELEVLAHKEGEMSQVAVVWNSTHQQACGLIPECLQPLQTERDKLRSELLEIIESIGNLSDGMLADTIIDAGWRPIKQQTESGFVDYAIECWEGMLPSGQWREMYQSGCRFIEQGE